MLNVPKKESACVVQGTITCPLFTFPEGLHLKRMFVSWEQSLTGASQLMKVVEWSGVDDGEEDLKVGR